MNILKGENIHLRALEPEDLEQLYAWENDPDFWHVGDNKAPVSRYIIKQYIAFAHETIYERREQRLMIVHTATNKAVGCIDLYDFEPIHKRAGVGILIDKAHQRCGYAYESLTLLTQYAFGHLQLHQLYSYITEDNAASLRLFRKASFVAQGCLNDWIKTSDNQYKNVVLLSLIAPR